jgi:CheY-like chemotaxis protein
MNSTIIYFAAALQKPPNCAYIARMNTTLPILLADDNEDDVELVKMALERTGLKNPVYICRDGEQVIAYLQGKEPYTDRQKHPFPRLLVLDLKMPNLGGLDVLRWVRDHPHCAVIPTLILSTSVLKSDIQEAYELGANAYLTKPGSFATLQTLFKDLFAFWKHCELPDIALSGKPPECA